MSATDEHEYRGSPRAGAPETALDAGLTGRPRTDFGEFASVIAHELRSPLQLASAAVEVLELRHGAEFGDDATQLLGHVGTGLTRTMRLLDAIQHYARTEVGELRTESVDCNVVLAEVLAELADSIESRHAQVQSGQLPIVRGDRTLLGQLFQNLIANAIKFNVSSVPMVRIDADAKPPGWEFAVADNGVGVDPHAAEEIFHMFVRGRDDELGAGTGVGLAVCARIVERHGGRIWVEPSEPNGSMFRFTLPAGDPLQ